MERMPFIKVCDQVSFEKADLSQMYHFAISIQDKRDEGLVLRPDYTGERLNLYFNDSYDDSGATKGDIAALHEYGLKWLPRAQEDPFLARTVVHCYAGVSRSSACTMMLLSLYYGNYRKAAQTLYRLHPYANPNIRILHMIGEHLGDIFLDGEYILEDVMNGEMDQRRKHWENCGFK